MFRVEGRCMCASVWHLSVSGTIFIAMQQVRRQGQEQDLKGSSCLKERKFRQAQRQSCSRKEGTVIEIQVMKESPQAGTHEQAGRLNVGEHKGRQGNGPHCVDVTSLLQCG